MATTSSVLCSTCQSLDIYAWDWDWWTKRQMQDGIDANFDWSDAKREKNRFNRYRDVQAGARSGCVFCKLLESSFEKLIAQNREQNLLPWDWPADDAWRKHWWIHLEAKVDRPKVVGESQDRFRLEFNHLRAILGWRVKDHGEYLQNQSFYGPRLMQKGYPDIYFHLAAERAGDPASSPYIGDNPTPEQRLAALKRLLFECDAHAKCKRPDEQELPTRCIAISDATGHAAPPTLCIWEAPPATRGRYLALSHRWTTATDASKTTKANYEARTTRGGRDGLHFEALPKVFQHTVELALDLGVHLVWIDSLCIVQDGDDGADKYRELQMMGQYYNNAYLTVAATVDPAEAAACGLYPPWKDNMATQVVRIPMRSWDDNIAVTEQTYYCIYPMSGVKDDHMKHVRQSELLTRGWVFQEWLLSRRVVSFTPRGMFLECRSATPVDHNGAFVYDFGGRNEPQLSDLFLKSRFDIWNVPKDHRGIVLVSRLWHRMVEIYSGLGISNPDEDRLLALAALSRTMAHIAGIAGFGEDMKHHNLLPGVGLDLPGGRGVHVMGPDKLGGIFVLDLVHGLLWYPEKAAGAAQAPPPSEPQPQRLKCAPTISWASIVRPVFFFDTRMRKDNPLSYSESGFQEQGWLPDYGPGDEGVIAEDQRPVALNADAPAPLEAQANAPGAPMQYSLGVAFSITRPVILLRVGRPFTDAQQLRNVTELTGYEALVDRCDWWAIVTAAAPHVGLGCAAFDTYYPSSPPVDGQPPEVSPGQEVHVLVVYSERQKTGSRILGLVPRTQWVHTVLFLRHSKDQEYKRVGIGRVFGPEFEKLVKRTDPIRVTLV